MTAFGLFLRGRRWDLIILGLWLNSVSTHDFRPRDKCTEDNPTGDEQHRDVLGHGITLAKNDHSHDHVGD